MIRSIFVERYKKVLIAACLLLIGVGVFNAVIQNNQWRSLYHDPNSRERFEKYRDEFTYWDEEKEESVPYTSYQEYRDSQLLFYTSYLPYSKSLRASDYSSGTSYQSHFTTYFNSALLLLVPLIGFLLFFIDQKTGFNQFLFSLGASRKELFKKKIIYLAIPVLLSILVGQSLYALLIHSLIPAPYMNATLGQLFTSVISNFSLLFFLFCSSAFIGSMVGNIFFGPLTLAVFLLLRSWLPNSIYSLVDNIKLARGTINKPFSRTLFVDFVGKMGGSIWANVILVLFGLFLMFWAYKKYQSLSLENDNAYILHKESRWSIWWLMTLFTSFILNLNVFDPWSNFLIRKIFEHVNESIIGPILVNVSVTLTVGCICAIVVFFSEITRKAVKTFDKLNHQTG